MHPSKIKGQSLYVRAVPWIGAVAAVATVVVGLWLDATGTQLGVPHPPFIGAWGPQATPRGCCSRCRASRAPSRSSRRCCGRSRSCSPRRCSSVTLILRLALNFARLGPDRARPRADRRPARRGQERVPAVAGGVRLRPALRPRPLRRARPGAAGALAPAIRPGLLLTMHYLGLDTAPRLAAFCIVVGALQRAAHLRARAARRGGARRADRRRARRVLARDAALRRHVGRRGLPDARPAGGDPADVARPATRLGGALALAVVSLFAWSLLAVAAWAALLVLARDGFKPAIKLAAAHRRGPARLPRAVRARHRLRPARHAAGDLARLRDRDRLAPPLRLLALRLPHGVPADPRRADRLARAQTARPGRARGAGDRGRDRDRVRCSASPRPRPSASGSSSCRS